LYPGLCCVYNRSMEKNMSASELLSEIIIALNEQSSKAYANAIQEMQLGNYDEAQSFMTLSSGYALSATFVFGKYVGKV